MNLMQVATTMRNDFLGAVKAALTGIRNQADVTEEKLDHAIENRHLAYNTARRAQQEAATMIADSLRIMDEADTSFTKEIDGIRSELNRLRDAAAIDSHEADERKDNEARQALHNGGVTHGNFQPQDRFLGGRG